MPLISVCIAAEPDEPYLSQAVDSVLNQSFADFELLICSDSQGGTHEYAKKLCHSEPRLRKIDISGSSAKKLNRALQESRGSLIQFLSAKDYLEKDCLKTFARAFALCPDLVLADSSCRFVTHEGAYISERTAKEADTLVAGAEVAKHALLDFKPNFEHMSSCCFRRDYALDGFDERYYFLAPFEFFFRLAAKGDYMFLSQCLSNVRKFEHQTESNKVKESLLILHDFVILRDSFSKFCVAQEISCEDGDFYSDHWADHNGVAFRHIVRTLDQVYKSNITPADVLEAAKEMEHWGSEEMLQDYIRIVFEIGWYISRLNWWRRHAVAEAREKAARAHKRGLDEMRTICDKEFAQQKKHFHQKIESLNAELEQLRNEHNKLLRSESWRMTAPIRQFRARLVYGRTLPRKTDK